MRDEQLELSEWDESGDYSCAHTGRHIKSQFDRDLEKAKTVDHVCLYSERKLSKLPRITPIMSTLAGDRFS